MPSNKNAFTRIVLLDKLLADRYHAYSIQDLTNAINKQLPDLGIDKSVTKRCIEKDIEYLEYKFPILIEFERYYIDAHSIASNKAYKKKCIRYEDPTFSIFKEKLTEEEKGLLSMALSTLGSFDGLNNFCWLNDLSKRLEIVEQQPIIQMSKNLHENNTLIAESFSAIRSQSVVKLTYKLFNISDEREVIISPYLLKEYNCRWYLIGAANDTGKILTFALDRIKLISILHGYKYIPIPNDFFEYFEDIIGISYYENAELHNIIFWASDSTAPYIDTKPIHGSQRCLKAEKEAEIRSKYNVYDGKIFSIECMENYELIRELCAFGNGLKVLYPLPIVESVKKRIKSMADLYGL